MIDFKRQTLLFDPEQFNDRCVSVVGLGNIGSHTALALARLGIVNISLWDFDTVEGHNIASQAYDEDDMGLSKVSSIAKKIRKINNKAIVFEHNMRFDPTKETIADIVIIAVDSMEARKEIEQAYHSASYPALIIDARIGGNQMEIYNISIWNTWKDTFSDNPSTDPCGGRYISYVSLMIAGIIANQVKRFFKQEKLDDNMIVHANTMQVLKNVSWK